MYIIGENIHIISDKVKAALKARDARFFQESAVKQVEAGAQALDLNLGPRKDDGQEVFPWMVQTVEAVVDVPLSFDSTNLLGIEAGLKKDHQGPADHQLDFGRAGAPGEGAAAGQEIQHPPGRADDGQRQHPGRRRRARQHRDREADPAHAGDRLPVENLIIDPLVLTVSGCQQYCPELIEAVRTLQVAWDPPPAISVGLSNVSNAVPDENRPLINRVYCAMLMGVGLQMMIANPLEHEIKDVVRIVETRDDSTPVGRLYLKMHDRTQNMEEPSIDDVDMSDPEQAAIWKTVQILLNKVIYAESYLQQ